MAAAGGLHVAPDKREIGYVAQEGALFPHLTVAENVAFGLPRGERRNGSRTNEALDLVGLGSDYAARRPQELSGGEQRRVGLARALAPKPRIVLLDEPFSGLDAHLRAETREAVTSALAAEGATAVLVTHDQAEALSMGREVAVLRSGRLAQTATPTVLYRAPVDLDVARFVGDAIVVPGTARSGVVECALGRLRTPGTTAAGTVEVMIRPEQIRLVRTPASRRTLKRVRRRDRPPLLRPGQRRAAAAPGRRSDRRSRPARSTSPSPAPAMSSASSSPDRSRSTRAGARADRVRAQPPAARRLLLALAACCAVLAAGCGGGSGHSSITLYNGQHTELTSPLAAAFEKATGVKVKIRTNDSAVLADQIIQEGGDSPADVYIAENSPELMELQRRGLLAGCRSRILGQAPGRRQLARRALGRHGAAGQQPGLRPGARAAVAAASRRFSISRSRSGRGRSRSPRPIPTSRRSSAP